MQTAFQESLQGISMVNVFRYGGVNSGWVEWKVTFLRRRGVNLTPLRVSPPSADKWVTVEVVQAGVASLGGSFRLGQGKDGRFEEDSWSQLLPFDVAASALGAELQEHVRPGWDGRRGVRSRSRARQKQGVVRSIPRRRWFLKTSQCYAPTPPC